MSRQQISARMGEIMGEVARIQSYATPTNAQLDQAEALLEEHSQLERQLRQVSLDELRAIADGTPGTSHYRLEPGAFGGGSEYDRDPFTNPADSTTAFRGKDPWNTAEIQRFGRSRDAVANEYRSRAVSAIAAMPAATDRIRAQPLTSSNSTTTKRAGSRSSRSLSASPHICGRSPVRRVIRSALNSTTTSARPYLGCSSSPARCRSRTAQAGTSCPSSSTRP